MAGVAERIAAREIGARGFAHDAVLLVAMVVLRGLLGLRFALKLSVGSILLGAFGIFLSVQSCQRWRAHFWRRLLEFGHLAVFDAIASVEVVEVIRHGVVHVFGGHAGGAGAVFAAL